MKKPDRDTRVIMDILARIKTQEQFETFLHNVKMLWETKEIGKSAAQAIRDGRLPPSVDRH